MNSTAKTILIWVLILVIAVGLYNFVERSSVNSPQVLNFTDLLNRVERGEVAAITIKGSDLRGRLTANNEPFRATIPDDYPAIFDRFTQAGIRVTVEPPDRYAWLGASVAGLPAFLILAGLTLWVAISVVVLVLVIDLSRFVKRELVRSGGNHSPA